MIRQLKNNRWPYCILIILTVSLFWALQISHQPAHLQPHQPPIAVKSDYKTPTRQSYSTAVLQKIQKTSFKGECQLRNVTPSEQECLSYNKKEVKEVKQFPLHYVSGVPGSGNDWILWLAGLSRYTWSSTARELDCSIYKRNWRGAKYKISATETLDCLFLKSHEPYYYDRIINTYAKKVVLLIRHPYDSAFAEYKRLLAEKRGISLKSSSNLLSVGQFIDTKTNKTTKGWNEYQLAHTRSWLDHATYWLRNATQPLHVLLYTSLKRNPTLSVESMHTFFGYQFDGANFRRHCCVMNNPLNPALKRLPSTIDEYKDLMFEEPQVQDIITKAMSEVHKMLDARFPEVRYRIERG